jgi:tetratricopeptide (TPR) repeat protein
MSEKGQIEKELKHYQDLAAKSPQDVRIKLKIAGLFFRKKEVAAAITLYREVADRYYRDKFIMKAIDAYHNILRICPTDVDINARLGELYQEAQMHEDALQQYDIAFYGYRHQGKSEKALEVCHKMLEISPTPFYRRKLAEIHQVMGKTDEAVREYEEIAKDYRREKKYGPLLEVYKLLLLHRRNDKHLIRDMSILYLHKKEPQEAIRLLDRAHLAEDDDCKEVYEKAQKMQKEMQQELSGKKKL